MEPFNFEKQFPRQYLIAMAKIALDEGAVFATCNPEYHVLADQLINDGLFVEVESPGGNDRAFALTDAGVKASLPVDCT